MPPVFGRVSAYEERIIDLNAFSPMQQEFGESISEKAEFIQLREVAAWLGVPLSSMREYVARGLLPSYKLGRHRLFRKREVLEALRETSQATLDDILK